MKSTTTCSTAPSTDGTDDGTDDEEEGTDFGWIWNCVGTALGLAAQNRQADVVVTILDWVDRRGLTMECRRSHTSADAFGRPVGNWHAGVTVV